MTTRLYGIPVTIFALCACGPSATPDLVLHNGKVFTADRDAPWAEAVAVSGNRIVEVGTSEDVLASAGPETEIVDVGGRVVVPGLNDAHYHTAAQIPGVQLGLSDDPSLDEVVDSVRSVATMAEELVLAGPGGAFDSDLRR